MAWARVQSKSQTAGSATTCTATFTSTPTTGNKIIFWFTYSSATATVTSVKDGANNNLTQGLTPVVQASNGTRGMYFYDVPATPQSAITLTISGANDIGVIAQEISGLAAGNTTAAALDGTPGSLSGSSSPTGAATYSSTASNEYLTSFFGDTGNTTTITVPSGWTADANNVNSSSVENTLVAYTNSTGGSETGATWTYTGAASHWSVITVAFKLAAGGGGATPRPPLIYNQHALRRATNW